MHCFARFTFAFTFRKHWGVVRINRIISQLDFCTVFNSIIIGVPVVGV